MASTLLAWLLAMCLPVSLIASTGAGDETASGKENEQEPVEVTSAEEADACDWTLKDKEIQEQTREVFRGASCHTFRWFDGLWGESYDFPENAVKGWTIFGAEYTEYDGFDPRLRVRVRAPLPNMNRRWDLILGRVDETAFVSDTETDNKTFFNPGSVNQQDDEPEWLLGLGHKGRSKKRGWDWSAGVRLRVPPRPYAKVQYYYNREFTPNTNLSFRQTFFWRSDDGLGTTSRGEVAHRINAGNLIRYEGIITRSEVTEGNDWYFGTTWFHRFAGENALSLLAFADGETDHEVPLKNYGFNLIWRRPFTREWMYLSMGPSLTWPREFESEKREMSLGFGIWIEIEFGDWQY